MGAVTAGSFIGGSDSQDLHAFDGSGVWAGGDVAAQVIAGGGIASVAAAGNLAATITADGYICCVRSGASPMGAVGHLAAAVTAGGHLHFVIVNGDIVAEWSASGSGRLLSATGSIPTRALAEQYALGASKLACSAPRTGRLLRRLAKKYRSDGREEDERRDRGEYPR